VRIMTPADRDGNAVPPNDTRPQLDPRIEAFTEFLRSVDRADWRGGQLSTRRLRSLGISVCLTHPQGDGGVA
jgi:hypothetical protein